MKWKVFDIVGPVMVGPSSSHTSGAVKLGLFCNKMLGGIPNSAKIYLHGSYADVYKGHGTDLALVAGLLGFEPDSEKVLSSFNEAEKIGLDFEIIPTNFGDGYHPNTAKFELKRGNIELEIIGQSVGGGKIEIVELNGMKINSLSGDIPTLIALLKDRPGVIASVTCEIAKTKINIASLNVFRNRKGGEAMTIMSLDRKAEDAIIGALGGLKNVLWVKYLPKID